MIIIIIIIMTGKFLLFCQLSSQSTRGPREDNERVNIHQRCTCAPVLCSVAVPSEPMGEAQLKKVHEASKDRSAFLHGNDGKLTHRTDAQTTEHSVSLFAVILTMVSTAVRVSDGVNE